MNYQRYIYVEDEIYERVKDNNLRNSNHMKYQDSMKLLQKC